MHHPQHFDPRYPDNSFSWFALKRMDKAAINPGKKRVGWLGVDHQYATGNDVEATTVARLQRLLTMNFDQAVPVEDRRSPNVSTFVLRASPNDCPFCDEYPVVLSATSGQEIEMGAHALVIPSADFELEYLAPSLIHHYITKHGYRPPDGFLTAVDHFDFSNPYDCVSAPLFNDYYVIPPEKKYELTGEEITTYEPYDEEIHW